MEARIASPSIARPELYDAMRSFIAQESLFRAETKSRTIFAAL
jgi:hypothetical protein